MDTKGINIAKVGKNLLKNVQTGESVALESLWKEQTCVITFLRRFGWQLCRLYSRRLSTLQPQLESHGVRMVGVGVEEVGVEEFVAGKFWSGELYVDTKKQIYKDMKYKRLGFFSAIGSVLGKKGRDMITQAKKDGVDGDMKGDGFQNGGTIIVSKGGETVLLNFVQESPADHVPLEDVLKALGIEGGAKESEGATGTSGPKVECQEDVCTLKK